MPYDAGRPDDRAERAADGDPVALARAGVQLDALRRAVDDGAGPGLAGLLAAAEAAHHEWLRRQEALQCCARDLDHARSAEQRARRRAEAVLEEVTDRIVAAAVAPAPLAPVAPPDRVTVAEPAAPNVGRLLTARLFGHFRVEVLGEPVASWHGTKPLAALRYLVARPGRPVPRDVLVDHLWPDADEEVGRRNLHQVVYSLRRTLREAGVGGAPVIVHEHDSYRIDGCADLWVDVAAYDRALREARRCADDGDDDGELGALLDAESLYTDDYLTDARYEEWTVPERERLRLSYFDLGERLAAALSARGRWRDVVDGCERRLRLDVTAEGAHRWLMRAHAALGQRDLALQQYRFCCEVLRREYDLTPGPETEAVHRALLA